MRLKNHEKNSWQHKFKYLILNFIITLHRNVQVTLKQERIMHSKNYNITFNNNEIDDTEFTLIDLTFLENKRKKAHNRNKK